MKYHLKNIKLFGYHGVYDNEKNNGQDFILNITAKIKKYNKEDKLESMTDYTVIMNKTVTVFNKKRYNLLETLINDIASEILSDMNIKYVKISIEKPNAPINYKFKSVEIKSKISFNSLEKRFWSKKIF